MNNAKRRIMIGCGILSLGVALFCAAMLIPASRSKLWSLFTHARGRRAVQSVLAEISPAARARLNAGNPAAVQALRHASITLVAFKQEKLLHVFATGDSQPSVLIKTYPILAASGGPGPKLREGDGQVPEGFYRVESLNPNSAFHLALRLDYPSEEDRRIATQEGRDPATLGGDIMIHGKAASIGCLAIGDEAIEEIFTLVAEAGPERVEVLILPRDPRRTPALSEPCKWVNDRYTLMAERINAFPLPQS